MNALAALRLKARFKVWARLRLGGYPSFYDSHSQFGEDMLIRSLFGDRRTGVYVDIGAHHPVYYSNTYHFYQRGWRGLNVDATPGAMDAFRVLRPGDVNLEACIVPTAGATATLFRFEDAALNTTDRELALRHQASGKRLLGESALQCLTLDECLDRYLPDRAIDLLSIDVEGGDEAILRSHDWTRRAPTVLVFERHDTSLDDVMRENAMLDNTANDEMMRMLKSHGYVLEGKCGPSFVMRLAGRGAK